jgi:drug/metabolite transporter (DMT)-like permease
MPIGTYLSLVVTMLFWGGTFIAGRSLAGSVPPATAAFFRFAIATLALAVLARLFDGRISLPPRKVWFSLLLLGLTGVFSYNVLFFTGLHHIGAGRASLIIALNPLAITLFATLLFKESLSIKQISGIFVSLAGAVFVISNGHPTTLLEGAFGRGELAILGCVASWSTYSLIGRSVLKELSPLASVFYSSLIGSILLLVPALFEDSLLKAFSYPLKDWFSLSFLGLFGTAIGFSLYYRAIRTIGASRSGVFINLVPFFSIILSWLILDETIKLSVLSGGILLLIGVSLTNSPKKTTVPVANTGITGAKSQ